MINIFYLPYVKKRIVFYISIYEMVLPKSINPNLAYVLLLSYISFKYYCDVIRLYVKK